MFKNRIKSIYYIILKPGENIHGTPWNSTHSLSGKHWDISQHLPVGWPHIITNRPHANPSTHTSIILGWRSRALCGFLQRPYRNWAAFLVYLFIYLFIYLFLLLSRLSLNYLAILSISTKKTKNRVKIAFRKNLWPWKRFRHCRYLISGQQQQQLAYIIIVIESPVPSLCAW